MLFRSTTKDYNIIGGDTIPSGTELQLNDNGKYYLVQGDFQMALTEEQVNEDALFEEVKELDIDVQEFTEEMEAEEKEVVKKWRIQLDIATTESTRKKIQKRIEEVIKEMT